MDWYAEIPPPPALRRHLAALWVHRISEPPPPEGRRLLPDGRTNLVWLGQRGAHVAGPQSVYGRPADMPAMLAVGARFHPGAAPYALRTSAAELADVHVALDAFDAPLADELHERLSAAPTPAAALRALTVLLERALGRAAEPDPAVREAVRILDQPGGTVAAAAERAFVSERHLQRRFRDDIGFAPKTLQRVMRFDRFMRHLQRPDVGLAGAAALAGYADQPHLTREARRLSGLTPARLVTWHH